VPRPRILVVHPEAGIATTLAGALGRLGYEAASATTAAAADAIARAARPFDLAVFDVALEGSEAGALAARLRARRVRSLLALTDGGDVGSRRRALSGGADDYVVKPLSISELAGRVGVLLDCARGRSTVQAGDVSVDLASGAVAVAGAPVKLTRKERDLAVALARAGGATVDRRRLLVEVWDTDWPGGAQTITVHVSTLRRKLGRPGVVRTARGGYRLASADKPPVTPPRGR
jgi:DNA-binding response OmpR family regulator